jgi:hypothetical protein
MTDDLTFEAPEGLPKLTPRSARALLRLLADFHKRKREVEASMPSNYKSLLTYLTGGAPNVHVYIDGKELTKEIRKIQPEEGE